MIIKKLPCWSVAGITAIAIFSTAPFVTAQSLGSADSYAVHGATTVTNTGATYISGNVGVSPGSAITGFPPGQVANGAIHATDSSANQAHADLSTAYTAFAGLASPPANNLTGADLGGMTLTPGVYHFNTSATLGAQLTFDAQGDSSARFVVQIGTTFITTGNSSVVLINSANARNVFFQVGSSATLAAGSSFIGNILAYTSVTAVSGSNITGRLLAVNGAVTLDTNSVSIPMPGTAGNKADFNNDGHADFVFENTQTGERVIWLLQNGQRLGTVSLGIVPLAWRIAGAADFNADQYSDLVWENTQTGERTIWLLKNGHFQSSMSLGIVPIAWRIASPADFNADGFADFSWENLQTGERSIWLLQNGQHQSTVSLGIVPKTWRIAGAADFNADGHADMSWENSQTGERTIWFLKNGQLQSSISLGIVKTAWRIAGAADFNADSHADFVWENTQTGERAIWFLRNGQMLSPLSLGIIPLNWKIADH